MAVVVEKLSYPRLRSYQQETEQQRQRRVEEIRVSEQKKIAARNQEALRDRFGAGDD